MNIEKSKRLLLIAANGTYSASPKTGLTRNSKTLSAGVVIQQIIYQVDAIRNMVKAAGATKESDRFVLETALLDMKFEVIPNR